MKQKSRWFAFCVVGAEDGAEHIVQYSIDRGAEVYSENRFGLVYHVLIYSEKPRTKSSMQVSFGRLGDPSFCCVDNPDSYRKFCRRIGNRVVIL